MKECIKNRPQSNLRQDPTEGEEITGNQMTEIEAAEGLGNTIILVDTQWSMMLLHPQHLSTDARPTRTVGRSQSATVGRGRLDGLG
jgi:hypothetical protein